MKARRITKAALKMAHKIAATIFNAYSVTVPERERLLNLLTLLSLGDLLSTRSLSWQHRPDPGKALFLDGRAVRVRDGSFDFYAAGEESDQLIEETYLRVEDIFDRLSLPEEERAGLFTALPCLGLAGLDDYLVWRKDPPFPE